MTPLPELLARAAGTEPVGFDTEAVRTRVVRRRRRQRAVLATAVVVVALVLVVGALALGRSDPGGGPADRPTLGPLTDAELSAAPWVLTAQDGEATTADVAVSVTFVSGGAWRVDTGCPVLGGWDLDGGRLRVTDAGPAWADCEPDPDPAIVGIFTAWPDVGRVAGRPGSLELRAGTATLAFERADRIGRPATADDLVGLWRSAHEEIRFVADGRLQLSADAGTRCAIDGTWEQDDEGLLSMHLPPSEESGACQRLAQGEGDPFSGTSTVRVDGDRLYLASQLSVARLRR